MYIEKTDPMSGLFEKPPVLSGKQLLFSGPPKWRSRNQFLVLLVSPEVDKDKYIQELEDEIRQLKLQINALKKELDRVTSNH